MTEGEKKAFRLGAGFGWNAAMFGQIWPLMIKTYEDFIEKNGHKPIDQIIAEGTEVIKKIQGKSTN